MKNSHLKNNNIGITDGNSPRTRPTHVQNTTQTHHKLTCMCAACLEIPWPQLPVCLHSVLHCFAFLGSAELSSALRDSDLFRLKFCAFGTLGKFEFLGFWHLAKKSFSRPNLSHRLSKSRSICFAKKQIDFLRKYSELIIPRLLQFAVER